MTKFELARKAAADIRAGIVKGQDDSVPRTVPPGTLFTLDEIFAATSADKLLYDEYRRKFEVSQECLHFFEKAWTESKCSQSSDAVLLERRCVALTQVLGDLIWLLHRGFKSHPAVAVNGFAASRHHSDNPVSRISVKITQAAIEKCFLAIPRNSEYLSAEKQEMWGWTEEPLCGHDGAALWHKPPISSAAYNTASPLTTFALASYVGYPIFYEDDRSQIVAVYGRETNSGRTQALECTFINGKPVKHDKIDSTWVEHFSTIDRAVAIVAESSTSRDAFEIFANEAVIPYQTRFKVDLLNGRILKRDNRLVLASMVEKSGSRVIPMAAISISFAVPVEPLHSAGSKEVEAVFGFVTATIGGVEQTDLSADALKHLSDHVWNSISYFQEPMLRLLVTERNDALKSAQAELQLRNEELTQTELVFKLIQEPLDSVAVALSKVQDRVHRLHGIFRHPYRGVYVRQPRLRRFFQDGELTIFGERILISHNPTQIRDENSALRDRGIDAMEYLLAAAIEIFKGRSYEDLEGELLAVSLKDAKLNLDSKEADREINQLFKRIFEKDLVTGDDRHPDDLADVYSDLKYIFVRAFKELDRNRGIPVQVLAYALPDLEIGVWQMEDTFFGESSQKPRKRSGQWLALKAVAWPFTSVSDFVEAMCKLACLNGANPRGKHTRIYRTGSGFALARCDGNNKPFFDSSRFESRTLTSWKNWVHENRDAARGDFADAMFHLLERSLHIKDIKFLGPKLLPTGELQLKWTRDESKFELVLAQREIRIDF